MAIYSRDEPASFERAMDSVLSQELPAGYVSRIYLGIDGPIPAALEAALQRYRERLHCISRSDANCGLAQTLNRLIRLREDEALFFRMDADDASLPGRFSAQIRYLEAHPEVDILGTAIIEEGEDMAPRVVRFARSHEDAAARIARRVPVAHPTVCMRARVLDKLQGYPERRGNEDIALWFECLRAGLRFDNLAEPYLRFTVSPAFWKRRSLEKAFSEWRCYMQGIYRLTPWTWQYIYPMARLALRLSPTALVKRLYASSARG
ncbi:MAG: glycosyltransferase [Proteobacteria bacterium]|nr:glycosyltransferase [Pseudomonadota bacterium]